MIKRINQYLVTNHPQIWNTKLLWMAVAILLTHIAFYIGGYIHFDDFAKLHTYYRIDNQMVQSINVGFSVLATFLILTIWLVFYLRNNPFKSFYPLRPLYFITEFAIIIAIIFSSMMFYKSYAEGFCQAIRNKTADINIVEEINTFNLAYGIIPEDKRDYKLHATCDSLDYIDSLEALNGRKPNSNKYGIRNRYMSDEDNTTPVTVNDVARLAAIEFNARAKGDDNLSLLHFCKKYCLESNSLTYSKYQISAQLQQWLSTGNRKDVKATLSRFDAMCNKYKIDHDIVITDYADYAFATKNFRPTAYVNSQPLSSDDAAYRYEEDDNQIRARRRIDYEELDRTFENIRHAGETKDNNIEFWLLNLFIALNLAILLFTFRLTPIRVWFTAVGAHFGLPIIIGLFEAIIRDSVGGIALLLAIHAASYILYFVLRKSMKKTAGVFLIWFTWWLLYAGIAVYSLLIDVLRPLAVQGTDGIYKTPPAPAFDFLNENAIAISLVYMLFAFVYIGLVVSRHFRKWLALPEE